MRDADCVAFLRWALPRMGLRWAGFRKPRRQVCRRLAGRLRELGVDGLDAYRRRLADDPAEWARLEPLCRVTISRFFRDRAVFDALGREVLPELARRARAGGRRRLRAWSAGCASGEEPYSLLVLWRLGLRAELPRLELEVVGSDVDPHLLERARRAVYPAGSLREVPAKWRERAFEAVAASGPAGRRAASRPYRLHAELRRGLELREEDLRRAAPPGRFDLVLCRNLAWTYFAAPAQRDVLTRIAALLRPGGVLVTGGHESPPAAAADRLGFEPLARSMHRRRARGPRPPARPSR